MVEQTGTEQTGTSAQRVRIGLTGLAFAFILVLLGSAISRSGEDPAGAPVNNVAAAELHEPQEPLAELGVAPGVAEGQANGVNAVGK